MKKSGEKSVAIDAKRDNANFERRKCNMTIHFYSRDASKSVLLGTHSCNGKCSQAD